MKQLMKLKLEKKVVKVGRSKFIKISNNTILELTIKVTMLSFCQTNILIFILPVLPVICNTGKIETSLVSKQLFQDL